MGAWDRFNGIAKPDEVMEQKNKFKPAEPGLYTAKLEKVEAGEARSGLPMMKVQFRTNENKVIFYNQMLQNLNNPQMTAVNIAEALNFVGDALGEDLEYEGLEKLEADIQRITTGVEMQIEVKYGKNDDERKFAKISIIDNGAEDDDVPFS